MNKQELEYIKENYFKENINLGFIFEAINEALEAGSQRNLLLEDMEGMSLTLSAIPEIDVTELGWTDVRTVGDKEVDGPARSQLLQFLSRIPGTDLEQKLKSIADFYADPDNAGLDSPNLGDKISNVLSYLVFYKTLTKVISNFNAASAGFNFEAFLAVLLNGTQIPANTGTIADFTAGDKTPISLKLYSEKSVVVGGSFNDLVGDLVEPKYGHDFMQYVVVMKSFEDVTQGLEVKGDLKFFRFNFTLDNVANIILASMAKSVRCIEISNEFIQRIDAGENDYDFGATLPEQENLSPEVLEARFIKEFTKEVATLRAFKGAEIDLQLTPDQIDWFTKNPLDWANDDSFFTPRPFGGGERVIRGRSKIQIGNPALDKAVATAFGEAGYDDNQMWAIKKAVVEATANVNAVFSATELKSQRAQILRAPGVFADPQASVEFYNGLTDPELKKKALLNTRGRLQNLQFDLNRGHVYRIQGLAGTYPALPDGQSKVNIGEIKIGAVYVQEMLNKLTAELNQSIFSLFQSVKAVQEGTYAFMAGGLNDDNEARKAITASNDVAAKTEELSSDAAAAIAQSPGTEENN